MLSINLFTSTTKLKIISKFAIVNLNYMLQLRLQIKIKDIIMLT